MGVIDGQPVNQAITNPAFINKNVDDVMPNQLGFNRSLSGPTIADIQQAVNDLYTATGVSESQSGTDYNATPGTITNGDTYELALTELADKFDPATGHMHTGAAGDGPLLNVVRSLVTPSGGSPIVGDLTLVAGANMTITESATGFTFTASTFSPTTIAASGNPDLSGQVLLVAGSGVTLTQTGQNITIDGASGSGFTLAASGNSQLSGDVVLVAGGGVTLSQSGQNITIAASGGGGGGSSVNVDIPTVTDLVAYSPTTQGLGTVSAVNVLSRRNGDCLDLEGELTVGTPTTAIAQISLGYNGVNGGITVDSSKITSVTLVGYNVMNRGTAGQFAQQVLANGGDGFITLGFNSAAQASLIPQNGDNMFGTGDVISFFARVPIQGWSANTNYTFNTTGIFVTPTVQKFLSGSGTYTTPTSPAPLYLKVTVVGGGGGGGSCGTGDADGTAGNLSSFGTALLSAAGGSAGKANSNGGVAATGGAPTINAPAVALNSVTGGDSSGVSNLSINADGSNGGTSFLGSSGGGGNASASGNSAAANTGGGGGGAGGTGSFGPSSGGGGGASITAIISSPSATYSYVVGATANGAIAGTGGFAGGNGGSGIIIVKEYYQ